MKVHQDPLFTFEIEEESGILRFLWTEKTANMTDDDFKRALTLYADFAEKLAAGGLLVDVRNFKHRHGPDIGKWRDEKIVPRYVRAGVKKLAYVVGSNAPMSSGGVKRRRRRSQLPRAILAQWRKQRIGSRKVRRPIGMAEP